MTKQDTTEEEHEETNIIYPHGNRAHGMHRTAPAGV